MSVQYRYVINYCMAWNAGKDINYGRTQIKWIPDTSTFKNCNKSWRTLSSKKGSSEKKVEPQLFRKNLFGALISLIIFYTALGWKVTLFGFSSNFAKTYSSVHVMCPVMYDLFPWHLQEQTGAQSSLLSQQICPACLRRKGTFLVSGSVYHLTRRRW